MTSGFVALVGRPNAGKSTLVNRLVGEKIAIVSDKPQTTRTRILGARTTAAGQAVFIDTPGIHKPMHRMNARMVDAAVHSMREVDVVTLVVDATLPQGGGDRYVIDLLHRLEAPVILALNKIDRIAKPRLLPLMDWYQRQHAFAELVPISALTGDGVDALERALFARLPEGEPLYPPDFLTDQSERTLAAEMVREKLLALLHDELPFTTAVVVDQFEEPGAGGNLLRLSCTILVEQASQKPIVVGKGGAMIKRIGTDARHDLERFFATRVFLDLHVKVKADWRDDERVLDGMGLGRRRGK